MTNSYYCGLLGMFACAVQVIHHSNAEDKLPVITTYTVWRALIADILNWEKKLSLSCLHHRLALVGLCVR